MKVVLFALTGYGNQALKVLVKKHQVALLVTRKELSVFPYYKEDGLVHLAKELGVEYTFCPPSVIYNKIKKINPDLILVTSYHRILPPSIYKLAKYAINIHPSILPKYKGPTPTAWAIVNGERGVGLTAHFLTGDVDGGKIILQKYLKIGEEDTEGVVRRKLSRLLGKFIWRLTERLKKGKLNDTKKQRKIKKIELKMWPKIMKSIGIVLNSTQPNLLNIYRALTPFPGAFFEKDGQIFLIIKASDKKFRKANYLIRGAKYDISLEVIPVLDTDEIRLVDLKREPFYIEQYIELRNHYKSVLLTDAVDLEWTREWLKKTDIEVLVLVVRGLLLGAVILYKNRNNEIAIFMRKGTVKGGQLLLKAIERTASKADITKVRAWVLRNNNVAKNFFVRCGFKDKGIITKIFHGKKYYGYFLEKNLNYRGKYERYDI